MISFLAEFMICPLSASPPKETTVSSVLFQNKAFPKASRTIHQIEAALLPAVSLARDLFRAIAKG